jgi:hypothetical protein
MYFRYLIIKSFTHVKCCHQFRCKNEMFGVNFLFTNVKLNIFTFVK